MSSAKLPPAEKRNIHASDHKGNTCMNNVHLLPYRNETTTSKQFQTKQQWPSMAKYKDNTSTLPKRTQLFKLVVARRSALNKHTGLTDDPPEHNSAHSACGRSGPLSS